MTDYHHVHTLEILTEGSKAIVPESLKKVPEELQKFKAIHRHWVESRSIVGFGVGHKQVRGHDTDELALRVYVRKKLPPHKCRIKAPKYLQVPGLKRVRTDVIELGTPRLLSNPTQRHRPASAGCSIGFGIVTGTLGLVHQRLGSQGLYLLSNSHVIAKSGLMPPGTEIYQPAPVYDVNSRNQVFATLEEFVQLKFSNNGFPNTVDAAVAKITRQSYVTKKIMQIGDVKAVGIPQRKDKVKKFGSTTSLTHGQILDVHFKVYLDDYATDRFGSTGRAGFHDQILVTRFSDQGDSGSVVLNDNNEAVGLLFAGTDRFSFCNKLSNVFAALKLEL